MNKKSSHFWLVSRLNSSQSVIVLKGGLLWAKRELEEVQLRRQRGRDTDIQLLHNLVAFIRLHPSGVFLINLHVCNWIFFNNYQFNKKRMREEEKRKEKKDSKFNPKDPIQNDAILESESPRQ